MLAPQLGGGGAYLATPIPLTKKLLNLKTNTPVLIGLLATGIHLTNADNLICTVPEGMNGNSLYRRNITLKRNTTLCSTPGVFYLCFNLAYRCLEANWTQICFSILLTPEISVYTEDQFLTAFSPKSQAKRAILLPVLIGAGIVTGIGTKMGDIDSSIGLYHRLSQEINENMEWVADSVVTLQSQINSLVAVFLQNR